ncbi:MBL fold metallo-hydrolase [Candidatus Woesearchaeota archaeon]|nr:MBL fold metallo-hydrolase [Candidatus Woesearchaeota archaeon]
MEIKLLAFDSFSVRSMATLVKTNKHKILLDPGIAIGPSRYGLSPSRLELEALERDREKIIRELKKVNEVFISHYHYDHHPFPDDEEFVKAAYQDKTIYVKDRNKNINFSQKKRGYVFEKIAKPIAREIIYCDGLEIDDLMFSPPVWHGRENTRLGYVIMIYIRDANTALVFAPDVQGPMVKSTAQWITERNPGLLIIGGPPTYMLGYRMTKKDLSMAQENLIWIMDNSNVKTIIVDHHLLRDINYRENFRNVFSHGEHVGVKVLTAARFMGMKERLLEARRKELKEK